MRRRFALLRLSPSLLCAPATDYLNRGQPIVVGDTVCRSVQQELTTMFMSGENSLLLLDPGNVLCILSRTYKKLLAHRQHMLLESEASCTVFAYEHWILLGAVLVSDRLCSY